MRFSKLLAMAGMAVGMAFSTATASAADRWDAYRDRQDLRHDYSRVERLRAAVARDRYRLAEDRRFGRYRAAEQDARDLARHERELDHQLRNMRRDRTDLYWNRR